ncbi:MAG: prenyltransferase/squalene oxidase repeat-containing protein, partial [Myxococcota bacterium]
MNNEEAQRTIDRGIKFLSACQNADGSWSGDYGGPMFLLPMYVAACHVCGQTVPEPRRGGMVRYLKSVQNPDGSIGLHVEDAGSMFTSVLGYAALRILGVPRDDDAALRLRGWILGHGTALGCASWGKLMLAVMNLYPYEGLNPITPELWLLPYSAPIHPGRMWCHARLVYLPMAWLYGKRAAVIEGDLIRELRADLYDRDYGEIDFAAHRDTVSDFDNRYPATAALKAVNKAMAAFEAACPGALRKKALHAVLEHIRYEDRTTSDINIGPVNSVLNAIVHHFNSPGGDEFRRSFGRLNDYVFEGHDGIKFNGYNSTALWDTAFAAQALMAAPDAKRNAGALMGARSFIAENRIAGDPPDRAKHFRDRTRGGWPFSDRHNGWPVSDCTAEGLSATIELRGIIGETIPDDLLHESVDLLLESQNGDGGWASYERKRGSDLLELLNPSQVFGSIM